MLHSSTAQLLRTARDALVLAAGRRTGQAPENDVCWTLGSLHQVLDALDAALAGIARDLAGQGRAGALTVVDGPFAGEPVAATRTAELWLDRARVMLAAGPMRAVDNAHIAASGIALPEKRPGGPQ